MAVKEAQYVSNLKCATEADHHGIFSKPEPTEEYLQDWLVRTCEIIDRYRPAVLYFDWWIQHSACKLLADGYGNCIEFLVLYGK